MGKGVVNLVSAVEKGVVQVLLSKNSEILRDLPDRSRILLKDDGHLVVHLVLQADVNRGFLMA